MVFRFAKKELIFQVVKMLVLKIMFILLSGSTLISSITGSFLTFDVNTLERSGDYFEEEEIRIASESESGDFDDFNELTLELTETSDLSSLGSGVGPTYIHFLRDDLEPVAVNSKEGSAESNENKIFFDDWVVIPVF